MTDAVNKKQNNQNTKNINTKKMGVDIDKAEYQEIVLSNSNFPDRDFYKRNYFD